MTSSKASPLAEAAASAAKLVDAFLATADDGDLRRETKSQVRQTIRIIENAFDRFA